MACRVQDSGALTAVELIADQGLEGLPQVECAPDFEPLGGLG